MWVKGGQEGRWRTAEGAEGEMPWAGWRDGVRSGIAWPLVDGRWNGAGQTRWRGTGHLSTGPSAHLAITAPSSVLSCSILPANFQLPCPHLFTLLAGQMAMSSILSGIPLLLDCWWTRSRSQPAAGRASQPSQPSQPAANPRARRPRTPPQASPRPRSSKSALSASSSCVARRSFPCRSRVPLPPQATAQVSPPVPAAVFLLAAECLLVPVRLVRPRWPRARCRMPAHHLGSRLEWRRRRECRLGSLVRRGCLLGEYASRSERSEQAASVWSEMS